MGPTRPGWILAATAVTGALWVGGCRDEPPPAPARLGHQSAGIENATADVDPRIVALFDQQPRQRVIVHLSRAPEDAAPLRPEPVPNAMRVRRRAQSLEARKAALLNDLAAEPNLAATLLYRYPPFAMLAFDVGPDEVRWLARHRGVARLRADGDEALDTDTSVAFTQADQLHASGGDGTGTAIAILDTAVRYWTGDFGGCPPEEAWVDDTPGCRIAVWENFNAYPNAPDDEPDDDPYAIAEGNGHGRNVAGIAMAMAPGAKLLAFNVFRWHAGVQGYRARRSDILAALAALPSYQASHGLVVANLSLGSPWSDSRPCNESDYFEPFRSLWVDHGLMATVSAGNGANVQWLSSPGCETPAITTGAQHDTGQLTDYDGSCSLASPKAGEVACFSNLNGMLDMIAPGVRIDAASTTRSGTSMAAPHVAGAIASLQSQQLTGPGFADPATVTSMLMVMSQSRQHNGQSYPQLDLHPVASIAARGDFPRFFREGPSQLLPALPHHFTVEATLSEAITTGTLLHLEVIHPYPEDLDVILEAPSGASVQLALPAGNANFNKLIGHHHLPGALAPFVGEAAGTWTLQLADTRGGQRGYYVSASLLAMSASCLPHCPAGACGPDGCGGDCGGCSSGSVCDAQPTGGTCLDCTPDCTGVVCGSDRCGGSCGSCDDGLFCNGNESCDAGACAGGTPPCDEPDELPCTEDCSETKKRCNAPMAGFCVIDGQCVQEGAPSPDDPCLVCDPAQNDSTYSPGVGVPCDDGDPCTENDTCTAGLCAGLPKSCGASNSCVGGSCDPATGDCVETPTANGTTCDDGDLCTATSCQGGVCAVSETVTCPPPGVCRELTGPCNPATGTCPEAAVADGTPCEDGGVCQDGSCEAIAPAPSTNGDAEGNEDGGCGCRVVGPAPRDDTTAWLLLLAGAFGALRRRR